jgi:DNA-binding NarL/FixJ family response regulator
VLIVDDQLFFASCMKIILEESKSFPIEVVGLAPDGKEALRMSSLYSPHVVLMDVRMPVMDGVEATRHIHAKHPGIKIMILTTFDDDDYVFKAMENGASGYILKNMQPEDLISSIKAVYTGTFQMSPAIGEKLVKHALEGQNQLRKKDAEDHAQLNYLAALLPAMTRREIEVLFYILMDLDNHEIAERLSIAPQTIRNYVSIIYGKLGVVDRNHAKRVIRERASQDSVGNA